MNETLASITYAKWKLPLGGGLISASVAGISLLSEINGIEPFGINNLGWIFAIPFDFSSFINTDTSRLIATILLWFFYGFGLTYFIKDNRKAIGCWFAPVILLLIFAMLLIGSMG